MQSSIRRPRSFRLTLLTLGVVFLASVGVRAETLEAATSREIADAAQALLATVPEERGGIEALYDYSRSEALRREADDEARRDWSYWPRQRAGLSLANMSGAQRTATQELLGAVLSAKGLLKVVHIIQLENILQALDTAGLPREMGNYRLVFFGSPSTEEPWAFRFEGHHVSLSVSLQPEGARLTPSFLGANPAVVANGPLTGFRVLRLEEDLGRELARSLDDGQKAKAILPAEAPRDILSGTLGKPPEEWDAWRTGLEPDGIAVGELDEDQKRLAHRIYEEAVSTYRRELTTVYTEGVDLASLHFSWIGSLEPGEPHYYRLQSGNFVFEYDNVQGDAKHIHVVWRDRQGDFGADLLADHYRAAH